MNHWKLLSDSPTTRTFDCFLLAGRYTLLDRSAADSFLPFACRVDFASSPAASTTAASSPIRGTAQNSTTTRRPSGLVAQALRLESVCKAHACRSRPRAIQFPFTHPAVSRGADGSALGSGVQPRIFAMLQTPIAPTLWNALLDPQ
jgi:D-threo-aldose 1-dehydrogenase